MSKKGDSLESLFTDSGPWNEKEVVEALQPFIVIQRQTNQVYFKKPEKLRMEEKIVVYALARKLLKQKGLIDKEFISASEFHKDTGFKKGTIDPAFQNLKGKLLFGKGNKYEIPNHKVNEVINKLKEANKDLNEKS